MTRVESIIESGLCKNESLNLNNGEETGFFPETTYIALKSSRSSFKKNEMEFDETNPI